MRIQTFVHAALLAGSAALLPTLACADTQSMAPGRQVAQSGPGAAATGIRPNGDTEISIDMSKIKNPDLPKIFSYIDSHIDEHVRNLQKWIQQPSISNTGEGIQESLHIFAGDSTSIQDVDERVRASHPTCRAKRLRMCFSELLQLLRV